MRFRVNVAAIQCDLDFADLLARYRPPNLIGESVTEAIFGNAAFYIEAATVMEATFTGIDVACEAIGFARADRLIDRAVTENLEAAPLSP